MKKMYVATLLVAAMSGAAFAGDGETGTPKADRHYFSVQAFYPVSTNKSKEDFTYANFTLAYGRIGEVRGADLSYGLSMVRRGLTGFQGSCLLAYTAEDLKGAAGTGVGSVIGAGLYGAQGSGLFNWVGGDMVGAQGAGVVNVVKGKTKGFQAAGGVNLARGEVDGFQVAPVNISGNVRGMQLGVVNMAGDVKGVQLGIVNVSKTMHGLPLGIVSISENGGMEAVAFGSSLTAANLGVRFRAGFVYTMLSAGGYNLDRDDDRDKSVAGAFHLGARVPVSRFYLDADAGCVYLDNGAFAEMGEGDRTDRMAVQGRAVLGFRITDSFSVFTGGGTSYIFDADGAFRDGEFEPLYLGGIAYQL